MAISVVFVPPNKATDSIQEFSDKADTLVSDLNPWSTQANALAADVNAKQTAAATSATEAADSATEAANSAASALSAPGTNATSLTSKTPTLGSQNFVIEADKEFVVGMHVVIAAAAYPATHWMYGVITQYVGTALAVYVLLKAGTSSYSAWTVSVSGPMQELGFGVGQTWQNLTASRAFGTVYQNTSARPIEVRAIGEVQSSQTDVIFEAWVGETSSPNLEIDKYRGVAGIGTWHTLSFVVPVGWYYMVAAVYVVKDEWRELR